MAVFSKKCKDQQLHFRHENYLVSLSAAVNKLNQQDLFRARLRSFRRILTLFLIALLLGCVGTVAVVELRPSFGAQVAEGMRELFGPGVVAGLETIVFRAQDAVKRWQYGSGVEQAEAPWEMRTGTADPRNGAVEGSTAVPVLTVPPVATDTPAPAEPTAGLQTQTAAPTPTATTDLWQLSDLEPFGELEGEGVWQPYLYGGDGEVVARRTFLQPDPERPYAIVAVVAFDLARTDLHFVLGFSDPGTPDGPRGDGLIPAADRQAGVLLAAFNGGFRTANGGFGAMANGIVALPPVEGMATVGIYTDGSVRIGAWGEGIVDSPDLVAWRQNCPLVIDAGEVSERVYNDSITDWGGTISNQIVARRSGLGLDREGQTLYYFAGPSLNMPALAGAMLAAGVEAGMLLDINHFWVHFTAFYPDEAGALVADPLLPEEMFDQVDRYLGASPVDFFYVTLGEEP
jgi:hypothetical protein